MTNETITHDFSEATHLFVEYASVVEQMRKAFEEDIDDFLEKIRRNVESLLPGRSIQEQVTSGYRHWWIGPCGSKRSGHRSIWQERWDPEIVDPGELWLNVNMEGLTKEQISDIRARLSLIEFPDYCQQKSPTSSDSLFLLAVSYGNSKASVTAVADVVAMLLEELANDGLAKE